MEYGVRNYFSHEVSVLALFVQESIFGNSKATRCVVEFSWNPKGFFFFLYFEPQVTLTLRPHQMKDYFKMVRFGSSARYKVFWNYWD